VKWKFSTKQSKQSILLWLVLFRRNKACVALQHYNARLLGSCNISLGL